ncbi:MAG: hypothetical protein JW940_01435 [Polyangiaceae bacterium]|nr:hypothetical protein [Polyangiaceae bacterium]
MTSIRFGLGMAVGLGLWLAALDADAQQQPLSPGAAPPAPTAPAETPSVLFEVDAGRVVAIAGDQRRGVPIGGPIVALHHAGTVLYVARGPDGVALYDVTDPFAPKLVREVPVGGGHATGFYEADGLVWVVIQSKTAIALDAASPLPEPARAAAAKAEPGAAPAAGPPPAQSAEPEVLPVKVAGPGRIELPVGAVNGVRVGDRFVVLRSIPIAGPEGGEFRGEERVTVAEVVAVEPGRALAEVGRSAEVRPADHARRAKPDEIESNAFPPRPEGVAEAYLALRPLFKIGTPLGLGVLADLEATYWDKSFFAALSVQPLGLGTSADGNIVTTAALAEGGYDGRAFSVGLGLGVSWTNGDVDAMLEEFGSADEAADSRNVTVEETQETHAALTLSQVARLGARDGLHLSLRNLLLLHEDSSTDERGFIYGGTTGRLVVPIDNPTDLLFEGGGGVMGYWFAGAGIASWVVGNGSPGSWRLEATAGGAGIWGSKKVTETYGTPPTLSVSTYSQEVDVMGPAVSIAVAHRFAP